MYGTGHLKNWGVVVEATETDAAASPIADVTVVQQLRSPFASRDNNSPFVDFDGQLISLATRWEECGAQLSVRRRHPKESVRRSRVVQVASPCSKGLVSIWRRNATRTKTGILFQ